MAEQQKPSPATESQEHSSPRSSPQTDPTMPRTVASGWEHAERRNESRIDEPGLTDRERNDRGQPGQAE